MTRLLFTAKILQETPHLTFHDIWAKSLTKLSTKMQHFESALDLKYK